jgi:hypothetical protein
VQREKTIPLDSLTLADAIETNMQIAMFAIQFLALIGLGSYVWYTRDLRKAAQDQIAVSQDLLRAANDQAEGTSKPCITIRAKLRAADHTLLHMDGAVGGTVVDDEEGQYVAVNIGSGVALNVQYLFRVRRDSGPWKDITTGYLQIVAAKQPVQMALAVNAYPGDNEIVFRFQSLGGRWYESTVMMESKVLTNLAFKQLPRSFDPRTQRVL